jgi:hypothetical protein
MSKAPSNSDDVIDSRDIIARIEELREERDAFEGDQDSDANADWSLEDPEAFEELKALEALAEECEGYAADWRHGEALIRDSYFKTYAQELADDIGAIDANAGWPNSCIDWDRAARELQLDYSSVDFDGVTYWIRN